MQMKLEEQVVQGKVALEERNAIDTFYYQYSPEHDAIELTVNTEKPVITFGNTTSHTYFRSVRSNSA